MPTSITQPSANSSFSGLTTVIGPAAPHLTLFTICLLLLLYGYEIFNFSLSIDEESFSHENAFRASITQGRWAIGLLTRMFPPLGNIPMISTVLFCAGLGVTACVLGRVLFRSHSAQLAFVGIFVSSPLWPHIAEFNQVSWGVGIGCVLLTLSLLLTLANNRFSDICAVGLLSAATGIYQTFFLWFLVLLCIRHLSVLLGTAAVDETMAGHRSPWLRSGLIGAGGLLVYLAVERLLLQVFSLKLTYVQGFIRFDEFTSVPAQALLRTLLHCWSFLSGADRIYLGYGYVVTLVSLLGLLIVVIRLLRRRPLTISQRLLGGAILVAVLAIGMGPILVSAATVPARSVFSWVPVSAFMAGITLSNSGRFKKLMYVALAAALFVSMWISVSLFYTDHIARQRDELLAARIMVRVDNILPNPRSGPIPFVIIGAPPAGDAGPFRKVEIFGDSFFDKAHEGGNPFRVAAYLRILGVDTLEPHSLKEVVPLRPVIEAMPVWPAAGSLTMVNGMLVIKLGPLPPA